VNETGEFSEADVAAAAEEARVALALVARAMNRTVRVVNDEVRRGITIPVIEGLDRTWDRVPSPFERPADDGAALPIGTGSGRA